MKPIRLIFLFLTALVNTTGYLPVCAADELAVMTYNIRYLNKNDGDDQWQYRVDAVAEAIESAQIIGLQEATKPQIEQLAERLGGYAWYGVGRDDGEDRGEFCPIFFKSDVFRLQQKGTFWLGPDPDAVGKPAWKANLPRICSYVVLEQIDSGKLTLVLNTHFDHQSAEARLNSAALIRQQADQLANKIKNLDATILMGDLNTMPDSEPLKVLTSESGEGMTFVDSRTVSNSEPSGPDGTWNGFKEITKGSRIDFILVGKPVVEVASHRTLDPKTASGRFASDHLPVLIELKSTNE